jgi:hypothetical protein
VVTGRFSPVLVGAIGAASAAALLVAMGACNAVLGIHEATFDADASDSGASEGSADASAADAGGEGSPALDAGADADDPCVAYCAFMKVCKDDYAEYLPAEQADPCMAICQRFTRPSSDSYDFDPGNPPAADADTLGCHLWHAHKASLEHPEIHCRHAGPLGEGQCGNDPCRAFCLLDLYFCADEGPAGVYGNRDPGICETVCGNGPEVDAAFYFDPDSGDLASTVGNSLNCRLWHLEKGIAINDRNTHCPHTDLVSDTCK